MSILRFAAASSVRTRDADTEAAFAPSERARITELRARALADVRRLQALARAARSDGLPMAALRAANATAAARSVLRHARRLSISDPAYPPDAVTGAE